MIVYAPSKSTDNLLQMRKFNFSSPSLQSAIRRLRKNAASLIQNHSFPLKVLPLYLLSTNRGNSQQGWIVPHPVTYQQDHSWPRHPNKVKSAHPRASRPLKISNISVHYNSFNSCSCPCAPLKIRGQICP